MKFIVCLLLVSVVYVAQGHNSFWDDELMDDILDPGRIQENVRKNIERMNKKIQKDIEAGQENSNAMRTRIENAAKSGGGTYTSSSTSSSSNSATGKSVSEVSGRNERGEKFYRRTEEEIINNILHRTETVRNPTTGVTTVYKYTQDLSRDAKPILVKETRTED